MTSRLQEKNGKYYVVINYKDANNKQRVKWCSTGLDIKNNKRKATDMMNQIFEDFERQLNAPTLEGMSMPDLVKEWLRIRKSTVRENSYTTYKDAADKHVIPYFEELGLPVQEIQPAHIQEYYTHMSEKVSPSTLEKHRTVINGAFEYAIVTLQIIEHNPVERASLPRKEQRVPKFYTAEQLLSLFDMVKGESIEAPVRLAATLGLRRSEALGLRWSDVNFKQNTIAIQHTAVRNGTKVIRDDLMKSRASFRTMPMTKDLRGFLLNLEAHQKKVATECRQKFSEEDYICRWEDGRELQPDYVTKRFTHLLKEKGMKHIRFHDLRHSSASLLINEGFTLKEVQEWLGQAKAASTEIYTHLLYKSKESMADRLEKKLSSMQKPAKQKNSRPAKQRQDREQLDR